MAVLVTGCAGFIGGHLCESLLADGERVYGLDALTDYYGPAQKLANLERFRLHERFHWTEGDLTALDLSEILREVDCVYHVAAQPGVRGSWGQAFDVYLRNNALATQRLLEQIKNANPTAKVVFSSSSSVYGNPETLPMTEDMVPRPHSPYGATKLAAEHLCMLYHANYGLPVSALRYFTVYGPRQRPDMAFHLFFRAALEGNPIRILGDGSQTRDFTYVSDIVAANKLAAQRATEGKTVNVGGGERRSLREVLKLIGETAGRELEIRYEEASKGDVRDTWASVDRMKRELGFTPAVRLEEGLRRQWEWHAGAA